MAATYAISKTLARVVAQAKGVTALGNDRVFGGFKRWTEAQNFDTLVQALAAQTQGYFSVWFVSTSDGSKINEVRMSFAGELTFKIDKETTNDFSTLLDNVELVRLALGDQTAYSAAYEHVPSVSISLRELDMDGRGMAVFDVALEVVAPGA